MLQRRAFRLVQTRQVSKVSVGQYLQENAKIVIVPVTQDKFFVYYKHTHDLLNQGSWLIRTDLWMNRKASQWWSKMVDSPKRFNKKIVSWVYSLLDNVSWLETSLKTIPGENYILKRLQDGDRISATEFKNRQPEPNAKPLHVYYPSKYINKTDLLQKLTHMSQISYATHRKYLYYNLLGLPLTIPLVLIPLVPNVPGFYLAYRAYSNFKALLGARHLQSIIADDKNVELLDIDGYSELFETTTTKTLNKDLLARILDHLEIHELNSDLHRAIRQEEQQQRSSK